MGVLDLISNAFGAVKEFFGWAGKRSDLNNTPEMQANAAAKTRQEIADKVNADIAAGNAGNLDAERKDAAE